MTDAPAVGFSITHQIDEKRGFVAQTHVAQDASPAEIDAVLDKVVAALARQSLKVQLDEWRRKLADDERRHAQMKADMARMDEIHVAAWDASGKKGPFKLGQKEEADKRNAESTLERYVQEIERDRLNIAECEAKLNGAHG